MFKKNTNRQKLKIKGEQKLEVRFKWKVIFKLHREKKTYKGQHLFSRVSCSEDSFQNVHITAKNNIFNLLWWIQKTPTYPWPNVSLVTLEEKQENSNCQQLLALYMCSRPVIQKSSATVEQRWQTGLKWKIWLWEGSGSKVICLLNSSAFWHLLYKSFGRP